MFVEFADNSFGYWSVCVLQAYVMYTCMKLSWDEDVFMQV